MKKLLTIALMLASTSMFAETEWLNGVKTSEHEFVPGEEHLEEGFATHYLNEYLEKKVSEKVTEQATPEAKPKFGSKITDWVTAPKFGGYYIGGYKYSSEESKENGDGFNQRLIRFYVDGTILRDFNYRIQIQFNGSSPHMKDVYLEWARFKEIRIKAGQFKRAFTFENPMNPWDVGTNDYSLLTKKLAGMGDIVGEAGGNGGRDQGIQIQGDLFPITKEKYRLIHYQFGIWNGQGINSGDKNKRKDVIGTLQVQPIKGLYLGAFGWTGNYVQSDGNVVDRKRWAVGATYNNSGWNARAEYAHSYSTGNIKEADAWYATVGIPCTPWLKVWLKYDVFRKDVDDWQSMHSIYSVATNFQLHKNLMFQAQYNYNNKRENQSLKNPISPDFHEFWGTIYFRF